MLKSWFLNQRWNVSISLEITIWRLNDMFAYLKYQRIKIKRKEKKGNIGTPMETTYLSQKWPVWLPHFRRYGHFKVRS